jgi:hypothetical protein
MLTTDELMHRFVEGRLEHGDRVVREIHSQDDMLRYAMIQSSGCTAHQGSDPAGEVRLRRRDTAAAPRSRPVNDDHG